MDLLEQMLLKRFLFCAFTTWTPSVWKKYPSLQIPTYPNLEKLEQVKLDLIKSPPLVFAGEIRNLKKELKILKFLIFGDRHVTALTG